MKPHIRLISRGDWLCECDLVARHGKNPAHAYSRWLRASIIDAQQRVGMLHKPVPRKPSVKRPSPVVIAKGEPAPINAPPDMTYPASAVQTIAGVVPFKAYRPAASFQRNAERASAAQPAVINMSSAAKTVVDRSPRNG